MRLPTSASVAARWSDTGVPATDVSAASRGPGRGGDHERVPPPTAVWRRRPAPRCISKEYTFLRPESRWSLQNRHCFEYQPMCFCYGKYHMVGCILSTLFSTVHLSHAAFEIDNEVRIIQWLPEIDKLHLTLALTM